MRLLETIFNKLSDKCSTDVVCGEMLSNHSSWQVGGPADLFVIPTSVNEIIQIVEVAKTFCLPILVIGGGSNLLFDDSGFRGIIVKIDKHMASVTVSGTRIKAEAGVWVPCLARIAAKKGLTGLEHICGIPGSLGGLIYMNGGSLRKSIGSNIVSIQIMDYSGNFHNLSHEDCSFGYRKSLFQRLNCIILEAELECEYSHSGAIKSEMLSILKSRSKNSKKQTQLRFSLCE